MPSEFNVDDIFEMAVQIEKNGAIFYREAAGNVETESHKKFLLDLALMEDDHEKTFEEMKNSLKAETKSSLAFDPDNENALYLKALADTRIFFEKEKPGKSLKNILTAAIQAEKDSISFYLGMKELVPVNSGQSKIDDIIKEEMSHIRLLAGKLSEYY
jgi:rubrerythrin